MAWPCFLDPSACFCPRATPAESDTQMRRLLDRSFRDEDSHLTMLYDVDYIATKSLFNCLLYKDHTYLVCTLFEITVTISPLSYLGGRETRKGIGFRGISRSYEDRHQDQVIN